jgi:aminoglycoside phosphotransferase (APT) family kinase protein
MIEQVRRMVVESWRALGLEAPPKPEQVRWSVINGGITIRSKLVCPVWVERPQPRFVVKFPRYPEYSARLTTEYRALEEIQQYTPRDAPMVPRPLMLFERDGLLFTVESAITGVLLRSYLREHPGNYVSVLGRLEPFLTWLTSMQLLSSQPTSPEEAVARVIDPMARASEGISGLTHCERHALERLCVHAERLVGRNPLPTVFSHHDPGTTNVLVDRRGTFVGLIDWESGARDLPLMDLAYYLARFAYEARGTMRADELKGFREFFFKEGSKESTGLPSTVAEAWMVRYCDQLGISLEWLPVLFALTLLLHARNERRRVIELRAEGQIVHGKPGVAEVPDVSEGAIQRGHFRSHLRYYLEHIDRSLPARIAGGLAA